MTRLSILLSMLYMSFMSISSCSTNTQFLKEVKQLPNYPSASGIEFYNNQFFIMGDDATHLLILDSNLNVKDSVQLYISKEKRIPKAIKPDLEAITLVYVDKKPQLLLTGSGSDSVRDKARLVDPVTSQTSEIRLDTFYQRLKGYGLAELNIEGVCAIPGSFVLSSRGHKAFPKNYLVFTSPGFWNQQSIAPINLIKVGVNEDTSNFQGVSGLAYARKSDKLILTVSTEDTRSVYEDGTIGKSYLWVVDNISSKKRWNAINPNRIIDLENADPRFKGYKIESACVIKETKNFIKLALVADNDDGSSTLFRLHISKN